MDAERIPELVSQMTLEEKATLTSGLTAWSTVGIERLGIPSVSMADGPSGLRIETGLAGTIGFGESVVATSFPSGCATASSWDVDLMERVGHALGREAAAEGLDVLLGPAINIKRSPLGGRSFEYLSEDPHLAGEIGAAYVRGVQAEGVGTSPKHFLANNQETRRMTESSVVGEAALREIYLPAFERIVRGERPWTLMSSYNRLNGEYVGESRRWLTDVLRDEWGFDGCVVSDWGAVSDRVANVLAGMDLEMPGPAPDRDAAVVAAVQDGLLDEAALDECCAEVLGLVARVTSHGRPERRPAYDRAADHRLAREVENECAVLLQNAGVLPLARGARVAFVGEFAASPRYQGGGSSHVNTDSVVGAVAAAAAAGHEVAYARGYDAGVDESDEALLDEAVALAAGAEAAVVFAGLPDRYESEGYDRVHLSMPANQVELIEAVSSVCERTVVVLHNGAVVEIPWADDVDAILEMYLGGEAVGESAVDLLWGEANPCGHLAESFPHALEHTPAYLSWPGGADSVYAEGIFVGYRYYATRRIPTLFPFGHGMGYTTFEYSDLRLDGTVGADGEGCVTASVDVTNSGGRRGKALAQFYVRDLATPAMRPDRELRGFRRAWLEPGETATLSVELPARAFAHWDESAAGWVVTAGAYEVLVCENAEEEELLCAELELPGHNEPVVRLTLDSSWGDAVLALERAGADPAIYDELVETFGDSAVPMIEAVRSGGDLAFVKSLNRALRAFTAFGAGKLTFPDVQRMVDRMNEEIERGMARRRG